MTVKTFFKRRLYFTGLVTLGIWTLLLWNHYHGGVQGHHLLQQENLPEISNWWGGLLLPILTWLLTYRIQKRLFHHNDRELKPGGFPKKYTYRFLFALTFGVLLSVFFTLGYSNLSAYLAYSLFPLALFFPVYRAECFLGFVIGMTFTFGVVLPSIAGAVFAFIGAVLYLYARRGILFILGKIISVNS